MSSANASKDLLLGILALQLDFITRDALVKTLTTWSACKQTPVGALLIAQGALSQAQREALEVLAQEHVRAHGNDPGKSLATVQLDQATVDQLKAITDPDVQNTITYVHVNESLSGSNGGSAHDHSAGQSTGEGLRYKVLKPHAQGGLGAVFVALDGELNRQVALKEILDRHADDPVVRQRFQLEAEITGKLEHPGVVPVYGLGTYANGRPFYAMRFIQGDSLKDVIARFHNPASEQTAGSDRSVQFRNLLGRFVSVCNALAYAHARGVLHRDVKPANIIVGDYGETLVVDWGLAKATGLSDPESSELTLRPTQSSSGSGDQVTQGVVGTPAYMSPEQARGEITSLSAATDIYALGATLYSMLTGRPPFEGKNVQELLEKVKRSDFQAPRSFDSTISPVLEAVCLKAMAAKPEDRYGSCKALAADVERWLADEPVTARPEPLAEKARRWVKKHRTLVTAAGVALVVGLVGVGGIAAVQTRARNELADKNQELTVEKSKVILANTELTSANTALAEQRKRAENREQLAIDAVKKFRDAVANEPMLKNTPALEELRKKLLQEPLAFFQELRERLQSDGDTRPESLTKLASAAFELGDLTDAIGNKQDALKAYQESLEIRRRLVSDNPTVNGFQSGLASTYSNIGNLLSKTGKMNDALKAYEAAREIQQKLVADNPKITLFQSGLAAIHNGIGVLLSETGKPDEAQKAYEAARDIQQKLVADNPTITLFQSGLAISHYNIGELLRTNGKPEQALKACEAAREIQQKLVADNPTVNQFQSDLAISHNNIGNLLYATGKPDEALKTYEAALEIQSRLMADNPTITQFQSDLAASHYNICILLRATGRLNQALKAFEAAREIWLKLVADNPTVTEFQTGLASSHNGIGILLIDTGKPDVALKAFEAAREIQSKLAADYPTITLFQDELAASHHNIGSLLRSTGNPEQALKACEAAREIWLKLVTDNPTVTKFQRDLAASHYNICILLHATGNPDEALKACEAAREIWLKLVADNPTVTEFQRNLAASHYNIGTLLRATGNPEQALKAFEATLLIQHRLVDAQPESPDLASDVGDTLNNMAGLELHLKKFEPARAKLKEAMEWQRKALRSNPRNPTYLHFLNNHLTNLIKAETGLGNAEGVEAARREQADLVASDPQFAALDDRLKDVANGNASQDNAERLNLAQHAYDTRRFVLATRLWGAALQADPKLAEDHQTQHRYNAACSAALAAAGNDREQPMPDADNCARLREQARGWLSADLATWKMLLPTANASQRAVIVQTLQHWQKDTDLASVRDPNALEALPEPERQAWQTLWEKVSAVLAKAEGAENKGQD